MKRLGYTLSLTTIYTVLICGSAFQTVKLYNSVGDLLIVTEDNLSVAPDSTKTTSEYVHIHHEESFSEANTESSVESSTDKSHVTCISTAIYHEARGEPETVQKLVARVIMNRVNSKRFPNDPCDVVNQRHQFSYHTEVKDKTIREPKAFEKARQIAINALSGKYDSWGPTDHFLECDWETSWKHQLEFRGQYGKLCFYYATDEVYTRSG